MQQQAEHADIVQLNVQLAQLGLTPPAGAPASVPAGARTVNPVQDLKQNLYSLRSLLSSRVRAEQEASQKLTQQVWSQAGVKHQAQAMHAVVVIVPA